MSAIEKETLGTHDPLIEELPRQARWFCCMDTVIPFAKFFAMGAIVAWCDFSFSSNLFITAESPFTSNIAFHAATLIGFAITALISAVFYQKTARVLDNWYVIFGLGLFTALGSLVELWLIPSTNVQETAAGLAVIGMFFALGISSSLLLFASARSYIALPPVKIFSYALLAKAFSALLFLSLASIPYYAAAACLAALPLMCAGLLGFDKTSWLKTSSPSYNIPEDVKEHHGRKSPFGTIIRFFLFVGIVYFALLYPLGRSSGIGGRYDLGTSLVSEYNLTIELSILMLCLLLCLIFNSQQESTRRPANTVFFIIIVAIAAGLLSPYFAIELAWYDWLCACLFGVLDTLAFGMFASIAYANKLPYTWVFGVGRFITTAFSLLSLGVGYFSASLVAEGDTMLNLFAIVMGLLVVSAIMYVFTAEDLHKLIGAAYKKQRLEEEASKRKAGNRDTRPQLLTQQYSLTHREEEVIALLLKGYTSAGVAEELCIAQNTAKTHIRNIYGKLEINSRDDLLRIADYALLSAADEQHS
jgi:DNA-binding CsgD family transcriptional regulator